jgi:hypothetical protein
MKTHRNSTRRPDHCPPPGCAFPLHSGLLRQVPESEGYVRLLRIAGPSSHIEQKPSTGSSEPQYRSAKLRYMQGWSFRPTGRLKLTLVPPVEAPIDDLEARISIYVASRVSLRRVVAGSLRLSGRASSCFNCKGYTPRMRTNSVKLEELCESYAI